MTLQSSFHLGKNMNFLDVKLVVKMCEGVCDLHLLSMACVANTQEAGIGATSVHGGHLPPPGFSIFDIPK